MGVELGVLAVPFSGAAIFLMRSATRADFASFAWGAFSFTLVPNPPPANEGLRRTVVPAEQVQISLRLSSRIVTGPSLTDATCM